MPQVRTARKKNRRSDKRTNQKIRRRSDKRTNQKLGRRSDKRTNQKLGRRSDKRTNQKLGRRSDKRTNQKIRGREGLRINQKLVKRSTDKNILVGGDYTYHINRENLPNFLLNDVELVIPFDSREEDKVDRIFNSVDRNDNWHSMIIPVYLHYNSLFMKYIKNPLFEDYITTQTNISYIDDYNHLEKRKEQGESLLEQLQKEYNRLWDPARGSNRKVHGDSVAQQQLAHLKGDHEAALQQKQQREKLFEEKKEEEDKIEELRTENDEIEKDRSIDNFEHFKDYLDIISLFITFCILFNRLKINDIKLSDYFDEGEMERIADNYAEMEIKDDDQITPYTFLDLYRSKHHLFGSFPAFCCHKLGLKVYEIELESLLNDYHDIIKELYTDFIKYLKHSIISTYVLLENRKIRSDRYMHYNIPPGKEEEEKEEYNLHIFLSNYFKDYNDKRTKYFNRLFGYKKKGRRTRPPVPPSELAKGKPNLNKTSDIISAIKNKGKVITADRGYLKKLILFLFHFDANKHKIEHACNILDDYNKVGHQFSRFFGGTEQVFNRMIDKGKGTYEFTSHNAYEKLYNIYKAKNNKDFNGVPNLCQFKIVGEEILISPSPEKFINAVKRYGECEYALDLYMSKFTSPQDIQNYEQIHDTIIKTLKEKQQTEKNKIVIPLIIPRINANGKRIMHDNDKYINYIKKLCVNIMKSGLNTEIVDVHENNILSTISDFKDILCAVESGPPPIPQFAWGGPDGEAAHADGTVPKIEPGKPDLQEVKPEQEGLTIGNQPDEGRRKRLDGLIFGGGDEEHNEGDSDDDDEYYDSSDVLLLSPSPREEINVESIVKAILSCYGEENTVGNKELEARVKAAEAEKARATEAEEKATQAVQAAEKEAEAQVAEARAEAAQAVQAAEKEAEAQVAEAAQVKGRAAELEAKAQEARAEAQRVVDETDIKIEAAEAAAAEKAAAAAARAEEAEQKQNELNEMQRHIEQELQDLKTSFKDMDNTEGSEEIIGELKEYLEQCKELRNSIVSVKEEIGRSLSAYNGYQTTIVDFIKHIHSRDGDKQEKLDAILEQISDFGSDINLLSDNFRNFITGKLKKYVVTKQGGGQLGDLQLDIHNYNHRLNGGMSQEGSIENKLEQLTKYKKMYRNCLELNELSNRVDGTRQSLDNMENDAEADLADVDEQERRKIMEDHELLVKETKEEVERKRSSQRQALEARLEKKRQQKLKKLEVHREGAQQIEKGDYTPPPSGVGGAPPLQLEF